MKIGKFILALAMAMIIIPFITPSTALAFDNTGWYWPVPDSWTMSRGFGDHKAIDIVSTRDTNETIVAARSGKVIAVYSGCTEWNGQHKSHASCKPEAHSTKGNRSGIKTEVGCNYGFGNGVVIDHGNGIWTHYAHMSSVSVSVGQNVTGGMPIGTMGSYGNSTGRHLHFAIKTGSWWNGWYPDGTAVNTNPHGSDYKIKNSWNGICNIYYDRDDPSSNPYIDITANLDGISQSTLGEFGTCDVYINGKLVAQNVNDYKEQWPKGTTYTIKNIISAEGYSYKGLPEYSGTLGSKNVIVCLDYIIPATLTVQASMDNVIFDNLSGIATFDVYVDDVLVASNVSGLHLEREKGTSYRVENVVAEKGYSYIGSETISGIFGNGSAYVQLLFVNNLVPEAAWQESHTIPSNIDLDTCEIQYKHMYKTVSTSSPGSGWVRGNGTTSYGEPGAVYESDFELETSDTRLYVGSYYYHYCGPTAGNYVEHYQTSKYTDYHSAGDVNHYYVAGEYTDSVDPRYRVYSIKWKSGEWADAPATCWPGRSSVYYRRYQYQDRAVITTYEWKKIGEWVNTYDADAAEVRYRIRLKDNAIANCEHKRYCDGSVCISCGQPYVGERITHELTAGYDERWHWGLCTLCGSIFDKGLHWRYCSMDACRYCDESNVEFDNDQIYHAELAFLGNESGHYEYCASCGYTSGFLHEHSRGCSQSVCMHCGFTYTGMNYTHENLTWLSNDKEHWSFCSDCGYTSEKQEHMRLCYECHCIDCNADYSGEYLMHGYITERVDETGHIQYCGSCEMEIGEKVEHKRLCNGTSCIWCGWTYAGNNREHIGDYVYYEKEEPTCTNEGKTNGVRCAGCEWVLMPQTVIPAKGHTAGVWIVVTYATETNEGLEELRCVDCAFVLDSKVIPKKESGENVVPDPVVKTVNAQPGDTVTLDVYVSSIDAYVVTVQLSYDKAVFELLSTTCEEGQSNNGKFIVFSLEKIITGKIGSVTLKIRDGVESGTYTVTANVVDAFDMDENLTDCKAAVDKVTIGSKKLGDVNGDSMIDGRDLLRLAKYIGGYDVSVIVSNASVNGDSAIDGRDLLRLAKYIGGYEVELK